MQEASNCIQVGCLKFLVGVVVGVGVGVVVVIVDAVVVVGGGGGGVVGVCLAMDVCLCVLQCLQSEANTNGDSVSRIGKR